MSVFLLAAIWTVSRRISLLLVSLLLAVPAIGTRIAMLYIAAIEPEELTTRRSHIC
jgi:hypothetical protein